MAPADEAPDDPKRQEREDRVAAPHVIRDRVAADLAVTIEVAKSATSNQ